MGSAATMNDGNSALPIGVSNWWNTPVSLMVVRIGALLPYRCAHGARQ
jgi:hypothetical protein